MRPSDKPWYTNEQLKCKMTRLFQLSNSMRDINTWEKIKEARCLYHQKLREAKAFEENYKYSILETEKK